MDHDGLAAAAEALRARDGRRQHCAAGRRSVLVPHRDLAVVEGVCDGLVDADGVGLRLLERDEHDDQRGIDALCVRFRIWLVVSVPRCGDAPLAERSCRW